MITPNDEAELAQAIAETADPVWISGGATRGVAGDGLPLSTRKMRGISLYEAGSLTMVAQAGTPLEDVQAALSTENQQLAFEPLDLRGLLGTTGAPTIGGAFAANASGPRRIQAGAARDFLLGVRFVDGRGGIIKNGGRVMKNVTGYDLVKLMAGAYGSLGVLSEVSFKVLPKAECQGTLVWHGLDFAQALKVFQGAVKSPFDITGAARLPDQDGAPSATLIRVEGFETSVRYRLEQLRIKLGELSPGEVLFAEARGDVLWSNVRDVVPFHGKDGAVWRSSIKPSDMPELTARVSGQHVVDWAGGLVWSLVDPDVDLRRHLSGMGGHATLVRAASGAEAMPRFHPQHPALEAISTRLRAEFDPRGILNPGVMG